MAEQFPLELPNLIPGFFRIDPPTISIEDLSMNRVNHHNYGAVDKRIVIYKGNKEVHRSRPFSVFINETTDTDGVMSYRFLIQDIPGILLAAYPESEFKPPPFTPRKPLSPVNTGFELSPLPSLRPAGGYRKHRKTKRKSNKKSNRKTRSQKRI